MAPKRINKLVGTGALLVSAAGTANGLVFRSTHSFVPRTSSELYAAQPTGFASATEESIKKKAANVNRADHPLKASTTFDGDYLSVDHDWLQSSLLPVLSASLLVTGNTIGAGCLVLPDMAEGPGLLASTGVFGLAYLVNLVSGLVIAEVAIKQREASGDQVPSSFKEFANVNLQSPTAATAISAVSLFVNVCVLSFDLSRAGGVGHAVTGLPAPLATMLWAGVLTSAVTTQSTARLSQIASFCVTALFVSFGGLLLPGLASVSDPLATLLQHGTSDNFMQALSNSAPVILMSLVYQNIVPSITKLLDYDRSKTVTALTLGSFLPLCLYLAWCYACLGGGIDRTVGVGGELMTVFSMATLTGSSLGSIMSLSEELDTYVKPDKQQDEGFQIPSVLASVGVPLVAAVTLGSGDDFTAALKIAGSFGSPLLYGVIPALMAWNQRQSNARGNLVPAASLGVLGLLSTSFVGEELWQRIGEATLMAV